MADKEYPMGAIPVNAGSGNIANNTAAGTMPADAARFNYLSGFDVTFSGATAGLVVVATLTGIAGGPLSYIVSAPVGATVGGPALSRSFPQPLRSTAINTAITLSVPALGLGNTNIAVNLYGYSYVNG